jgi:hypothetical protein
MWHTTFVEETGKRVWSRLSAAAEGFFGVVALILGLSILSIVPLGQWLSLGYLLESSGRVARTGRLRDGVIGFRTAARLGRWAAGVALSFVPLSIIGSMARSAAWIDPTGPVARTWRIVLACVFVLTILHILGASIRGGRIRDFLWPPRSLLGLIRRLRRGGVYTEARDKLWAIVSSLRLGHYFWIGLVGFGGTLVWLAIPAALIAAGRRAPILTVIGALILLWVVPWIPLLQVHFAVGGRVSALFARRSLRDRYRRAPWAFAIAVLAVLLAALPLYLFKIELIPRGAVWLPSLVFVVFLAPARLLAGWAYARSERSERARHWFSCLLGRLAILPVAALYVLVVILAQYTSWEGAVSLFEQHAFLLPAPFLTL